MVESGRRADGNREEGRRVKRVDAGIAVEAHPSQKPRRMGATHSYSQGFTQKHPNWLHLKTSPGMQVITFVPDETPKGLACCACAFDAMIGVHSRAAAMKSLLRLSIFIKSSWFFFNYRIVGSIKGYVNRMLLRSASFENSIKMDFILISHFGFLVTLASLPRRIFETDQEEHRVAKAITSRNAREQVQGQPGTARRQRRVAPVAARCLHPNPR